MFPNIKVLYISGYSGDMLVSHGVDAQAAYLQKPFLPRPLSKRWLNSCPRARSSASRFLTASSVSFCSLRVASSNALQRLSAGRCLEGTDPAAAGYTLDALTRIIHEHFCCNRRSAVPTSLRPAHSPLRSGRLTDSAARTDVALFLHRAVRPSTYCTSTPQVLWAPRAGLTTRLGDFATTCHE